MRILIISPSFFPIVGGTEVAIFEISKRLVKKGYDIIILTPKYPEFKDSKQYEEIDSIQVCRFPISHFMYKFSTITKLIDFQIRAFRKIIEIHKIKNFDIFHQIHLFDLGGAAVLAKKILGKPLITTLGGWDTYDPLIQLSKIFYPYRKWVMKNSDVVTAISKNLATNAKFQGYKKKIHAIPHGVDSERFKRSLINREDTGINNLEGKAILVSVQRLVPRKATLYLLKAFRIVVDKLKEVKLLLIGDGPERKNLESFVEKAGIQNYVLFLGEIDQNNIVNYYALSDIFVLHTLYEGLGIVLLEAMACRKPVICTVAGATREVVEDGRTGILVPPKNPKALAEAIMKLIMDKELGIKMGIEGQKKVEREYDWNIIVEKYIKLYRRCVNGQG